MASGRGRSVSPAPSGDDVVPTISPLFGTTGSGPTSSATGAAQAITSVNGVATLVFPFSFIDLASVEALDGPTPVPPSGALPRYVGVQYSPQRSTWKVRLPTVHTQQQHTHPHSCPPPSQPNPPTRRCASQ